MSYELSRLMSQYGVGSPSMAYLGPSMPMAPDELSFGETEEEKEALEAAKKDYLMRKSIYDSNRALFEKYTAEYQNRLKNTPIYSGAQFQTKPLTDVAQNSGSIWGAPLNSPTYQNYPPLVVASLASSKPAALTIPGGMRSGFDSGFGDGFDVGFGGIGVASNNAPVESMGLDTGFGGDGANAGAPGGGNAAGGPGNSGDGGTGDSSTAGGDSGGVGASDGSGPGAGAGTGGASAGDSGDGGVGAASASDGWARGGSVQKLAQKYQVGGVVRRFQKGGDEGEIEIQMPAVMGQPSVLAPMPPQQNPMAAPISPMAVQPGDRNQALMAMLGRYFPQGDEYGQELKAARQTMTQESEAFNKLLQDAIKQPQESGPSKAEMYFRLAAAFGAPTKTGNFMESLGTAGGAASEMLKDRRASEKEGQARKLQLGLEAQKLRMTGAKEDLSTLRQLAAEGMKDKRTVASELIKEYVKSGQPQSSAGKQALDEGLRPGTPEYQKRVSQIAELNVERQMGQIQATLSNLGLAQANAALQQQRFGFQRELAAKLTAPEMKLKTETEDLLGQVSQGYKDLKRAMELNPNTFDTSLLDTAQRKALEAVGSKDPKVINTRELENMLEKAALSQLKATFGGAITDGERAALLATQGMMSKSVEERARIMQNAAAALKSSYARNKKRLNEINQGAYRATQMPGDE